MAGEGWRRPSRMGRRRGRIFVTSFRTYLRKPRVNVSCQSQE